MVFDQEPIRSFDVPEPFKIMEPKVSDWHEHKFPELHQGYATGRIERFSDGSSFRQELDVCKMPQYRSELRMPQGTFIPPDMLGPL